MVEYVFRLFQSWASPTKKKATKRPMEPNNPRMPCSTQWCNQKLWAWLSRPPKGLSRGNVYLKSSGPYPTRGLMKEMERSSYSNHSLFATSFIEASHISKR